MSYLDDAKTICPLCQHKMKHEHKQPAPHQGYYRCTNQACGIRWNYEHDEPDMPTRAITLSQGNDFKRHARLIIIMRQDGTLFAQLQKPRKNKRRNPTLTDIQIQSSLWSDDPEYLSQSLREAYSAWRLKDAWV